MSDLVPDDYAATLEDLKRQVHAARLRVQRKANTELLQLWWSIGRTILNRQAEEGWGSKVLGRLAADLRAEFPSMKGFSRANLFYMRGFAEAWPDADAIVQRPIGLLPWGHVIELLDKLDDQELRDWCRFRSELSISQMRCPHGVHLDISVDLLRSGTVSG